MDVLLAYSSELRVACLAELKANGLAWIRIHLRQWHKTLRNPMLGFLVEITAEPVKYAVEIDSADGLRLLRRLDL
jgi:hypothetical protein